MSLVDFCPTTLINEKDHCRFSFSSLQCGSFAFDNCVFLSRCIFVLNPKSFSQEFNVTVQRCLRCVILIFQRSLVPKVRFFESPLFRRSDIPRVLCSEGPIPRRYPFPKVRYSKGPLFGGLICRRSVVGSSDIRGSVVPKVRYSEGPLFRSSDILKVGCSAGPIFQRSVVPKVPNIRHHCLQQDMWQV